MRRLIALGVFAVLVAPLPALAHPHIFIDAKATIVFDADGLVEGIHNEWTFDEAYSAWAIQGLDTDGDGKVTRAELQALADDNMQGLSEYQYYTFAGEGPGNLEFVHGSNDTLDYVDGHTTLSFDVALAEPYRIKEALEIAINDPEYYVAITFAGPSAVKLVNAPANCRVEMEPGHTMPDDIAAALYALPPDVTKLPPDLEKALRGVQGAILVKCPGGSAAAGTVPRVPPTALEAVNDLASARPSSEETIAVPPLVTANVIPFGGPPPEPGLNLPRTGFLGWVAQAQKDFYQALTAALGRLRSDWTAFWILGGLSFLYGVFHAAGPGHGKVVISSYVLANEAQVRRGILLSFLSAMMQSAVAIGFVLVAAALLGMTSLAMSDAANWIGIVSYGLVALLGLWLIIRKVFNLGHRHTRDMPHAAKSPEAAFERRHLERRARAHALLSGRPATELVFAGAGPDAYGRTPGDPHYGHDHDSGDHQHHNHGKSGHDDHGHAHVVTADQVKGNWREQLGVVVGVGLRPCSGALVVLVFALSQGVLAAGIVAVLLMGLGTAITTGTLAALAVGAKSFAMRLSGADNPVTGALVWWAELLGAVAVFGFGIILLLASV